MLRFASTPTIVLFVLALLLPLASASAAKQFNLDYRKNMPACWVHCHQVVVGSIGLPGWESNFAPAFSGNCRNPPYVDALAACLASQCESAPDAAYAAEFATSICDRAGVDVQVKLPDAYVTAAAEYFQSEAYLSRGTKGASNWGLGGVILLALPAVLAMVM